MGGRAGGGASGGMGSRSRGASARANQLANQYLGGVNNPALKKELASALAEYEKEFGPLEAYNSAAFGSFKWLDSPWPWEREANI